MAYCTRLSLSFTFLLIFPATGGSAYPITSFTNYNGGYLYGHDAAGNVVVAGTTTDPGFPTTDGAYSHNFVSATCGVKPEQRSCAHVFVAKLSPSGDRLIW